MNWIIRNKEWLFSGILVAVPLALFGARVIAKRLTQNQRGGDNSVNVQVGGNVDVGKRGE